MTADRTDFGGRLRQAREARGLSLAQIAAATKISTMALDALERNDMSRLPGGLFSRAFVRAYASEVGLDPVRTVEEFAARFADDLDPSEQPRRSSAIADAGHGSGSGLRWFGLVLTVALVGLFFGVQRYLARHEAAPVTPRSASASAGQTNASARPPAPADATSAATASPSTLPAAQAADASQTKSEAPGGTLVPAPTGQSPTSAGQPAALNGAAASVPAEQSATAPAPAPGTQAASFALRLVVTATAPCWLSAKVDGNRMAGRTLAAGGREELGASESIVLTVGDAGAMSYTINGNPGRTLGKAGQPVTVVISAANYQGFIER